MKFFADTADIDAIRELNETGLLDGVTTNPSLIMKSGRDIMEVTKEICDIVDGPVSAEVTATDFEGMMKEAEILSRIADNICIKVPLTMDGLKAHGVARMLSNRHAIMVRSGYHCAQPLHEIHGLPETVRISLHLYNTREEIETCVEAIRTIAKMP